MSNIKKGVPVRKDDDSLVEQVPDEAMDALIAGLANLTPVTEKQQTQDLEKDPIIQQLKKLGIAPTQEAYLALTYPEQEMDAELESNLPDHFFDLPKE